MSGKKRAGLKAEDPGERMTYALLMDGFGTAFLGFGTQFTHEVALYDYRKCVEVLTQQGLTPEDAEEHLEFNVAGAWVGPNTPVLLRVPALEAKIDHP